MRAALALPINSCCMTVVTGSLHSNANSFTGVQQLITGNGVGCGPTPFHTLWAPTATHEAAHNPRQVQTRACRARVTRARAGLTVESIGQDAGSPCHIPAAKATPPTQHTVEEDPLQHLSTKGTKRQHLAAAPHTKPSTKHSICSCAAGLGFKCTYCWPMLPALSARKGTPHPHPKCSSCFDTHALTHQHRACGLDRTHHFCPTRIKGRLLTATGMHQCTVDGRSKPAQRRHNWAV